MTFREEIIIIILFFRIRYPLFKWCEFHLLISSANVLHEKSNYTQSTGYFILQKFSSKLNVYSGPRTMHIK